MVRVARLQQVLERLLHGARETTVDTPDHQEDRDGLPQRPSEREQPCRAESWARRGDDDGAHHLSTRQAERVGRLALVIENRSQSVNADGHDNG